MVSVPSDCSNPIELTDWLELTALEADDGNASIGDLVGPLTILSDDNLQSGGATQRYIGSVTEEITLQVLTEVENRSAATAEAYPFIIKDGQVLQTKENRGQYAAYVFCLCLSYFHWKSTKGAINPWFLFEDLASLAAKHYLHGEVYKFGSSSTLGQQNFPQRVDTLCELIGEGRGFKSKGKLQPKDGKVDVVAWKNFADSNTSKLIMFGQCAAGATNWENKAHELDPQAFWDQWIAESKVSPLLRSFYIPFCLPHDKFEQTARRAGILFDRCRIAHSVWLSRQEIINDGRYQKWCESVFPGSKRS